MKVYHYDMFYKFYTRQSDKNISDEDAQRGLGIPACATLTPPPVEQCSHDEIPVFKKGSWVVEKDNFWRPNVKEINYDAGRNSETFNYIDFDLYDFLPFSGMPLVFSSSLVSMRLSQSIRIINKKFQECLNAHKKYINHGEKTPLTSFQKGELTLLPSEHYEMKSDLENIIFLMRRVLDSLVQTSELLVDFNRIEQTKKFKYESIGSILSPKNPLCPIRLIILGGQNYDEDKTNFLEISNNLFNSYKHSLMHDESYWIVGKDTPTFVGFLVKHANYKKEIQFHNHNAFHIMMGFQDNVERILRNQHIFRTNKT